MTELTEISRLNLWFAYYDSLFSYPHLVFPNKFAIEINSACSPSTPTFKRKWVRGSCPQLAECYQLLQAFLLDQENWTVSHCTSDQLKNIEENLNLLMNFLELQKGYAQLFWQMSPRRIQASATHFYHFLQYLTRSIIPYSSMTIFQCKAANKLCINLMNFQKLMNRILQKINAISEYLSSLIFEEQRSLTYSFMENWVYFMKKIPTIKKNKIQHVPSLTKYIILNNPIQLSKTLESPRKVRNRKKSNTIGSAYKCENKSDQSIYQARSKQILKQMGDIKYQIRWRSYSAEDCSRNLWAEEEENEKKMPIQRLFKFPVTICKYSQNTRLKKNTLQSFHTLTTKISSIQKNKSNTISMLNIPPVNKRVNTESIAKHKSMIRSKKRSLTRYYQEQQERNQLKSVSSGRSNNLTMANTLQNTLHTHSIHKKALNRACLNQRKQETIFEIMVGDSQKKNQIVLDVTTGDKKSKGWDFVRKYVWDRIRERKMKNILTNIIQL